MLESILTIGSISISAKELNSGIAFINLPASSQGYRAPLALFNIVIVPPVVSNNILGLDSLDNVIFLIP